MGCDPCSTNVKCFTFSFSLFFRKNPSLQTCFWIQQKECTPSKYFCIFVEGPASTFTRSGPTYDQRSLCRTDDDDDDDHDDDDYREYDRRAPPQAAAAAWNLPPQSSRPSQPSSGLNMGRGRGRGRGLQSNQPLRRPNLPGMAAGTAAANQGEGTVEKSVIVQMYCLFC